MPSLLPSLLPLTCGAVALASCAPLNGVDPLDSGEHAAAVLNLGPSSATREDERKLQDERVQRLSGAGDQGSSARGSVGVDVISDF